MPRPVKWRRVEYIPENKMFAPCSKGKCPCLDGVQEVQLKIEELEAMRLKDMEELSQEECAVRMQISRQTFQNIIDEARKKVVRALLENKAITIGGGHYTKNVCYLKCSACGTEMMATYEERGLVCQHCGSDRVECNKKQCCQTSCEK
ncbi:putative DNA-binding protein [Desulfosporosinus acidiphilus SJ4]|uniref:UPF0251 protein Desaci_4247 n=1 Tax=Desulfosporosinus acidiphilus (strain DSM 22704 / JCM 16185 / SJ4) TaxID=646529 RepID=I4DBD0_DESAJ|nr:DUF134 domain-containing protein [Desulfosporosinus acidiphilus]AFM43104.1 putative DNA-binding protein [Desulfosporosinus acidiphilus SJ4]